MSVLRVNKFEASVGKSEELYEFLCSLKSYITSSKGNISYDVARDFDKEGSFLVLEKWDTIESHTNSVQNFPKEEMSSAMSLFGAPPEGRYYKI